VAAHGDNSLYQQTQIFAKGGDIAAALSRLAEARRQRDADLALLRNDPLLLLLHVNPEFNARPKSLGFV
jgi:hypothetical protein